MIAIGVDNIFVLTNGVVATSIDLPVRERIAHGLSHVGVRITMGLLTHLTVFVVGSLTSIDALRVRQTTSHSSQQCMLISSVS